LWERLFSRDSGQGCPYRSRLVPLKDSGMQLKQNYPHFLNRILMVR
jgi:hypothetical protein